MSATKIGTASRLAAVTASPRTTLVFAGDAVIDWLATDVRSALANHERAGRRQAVRIFARMVQWMDRHAAALKRDR